MANSDKLNENGRLERLDERPMKRREFLAGSLAASGLAVGKAAFGRMGISDTRSGAHRSLPKAPVVNPSATILLSLPTGIDSLEMFAFTSDAAYNVKANVTARVLEPTLIRDKSNPLCWVANGAFSGWAAQIYKLSPDGRAVTFHLQPKAAFSDGAPVTAQDFAYTLKRGIELPGSSVDSPNSIIGLTSSSQVHVLDSRTVMIDLPHSSPLTAEVFGRIDYGIAEAAVYEKNATKADPWAEKWASLHVTGSGPYQLESWVPGVQAVLTPNPGFWNRSLLQNSGVTVKFVPNGATAQALLERGDLDIVYGLPTRNIADVAKSPGVDVYSFPSNASVYMGMNCKIPPFDDVRVRQALSYAIPYDTIIKEAMHGYAGSLKSYVPAYIPTSDYSLFKYQKNLAKAKQLLAEAGHPRGFAAELTVQTSEEDWVAAAVWIQSGLQQIGVDLKINSVSDAAFFAQIDAKELPLFLDYFQAWVNDPFYWFRSLLTTTASENFVYYSNPQVDRLVAANINNPASGQRAAASRQIQGIIMEDAPWALLFTQQNLFAARSNVSGLTFTPDNYLRYERLGKA